MKKYYTIGEIAKNYNLHPDTIRHYEELGMLFPERTKSGYRIYSLIDLCRLEVICDLRKLDFSLEEIKEFLNSRTIGSSLFHLNKKLQKVREQIFNLRIMEQQINSKINNIRELSYRKTDVCEIAFYPDRHCLKYPVRSENESDYIMISRTMLNTCVGQNSMMGNLNVGRELRVTKGENGSVSCNFEAVFIIDEELGDNLIAGGIYISMLFRGGSRMAAEKLRIMFDYAEENGYEPIGKPLLMIITDSHESEDSNDWWDELQLPVRKKENIE